MSGKNNITVRKQKIRKNHTKAKLVFFLVLTALLLFVAAFAKYLCPYDPYAQDLALAQKPPGPEHTAAVPALFEENVWKRQTEKLALWEAHSIPFISVI